MVELTKVAGSVGGSIAEGVWSCTKNFFQGVWDATGGAVLDGVDCFWHPIDCAEKAIQGVKNTWKFIKDLNTNLKNMYAAISNLSTQQKVDILCEIIGSIAGPVAIAILTAGSGSGLIARTLANLTQKVVKLGRVLKRIPKLPHRKLAKLADDVLDKVDELAGSGYEWVVKHSLDACPL